MPAGRDTDWTHVRVVGERAAAAPYLSFGRKLLGYVKQDAAHNGLQTHKVSKQLPDGALVVAEIHGKQPIITIVPPRLIPLGLKRMEDRFVTLARREGLWSGIDPEHPEQWLDAPGVSRRPDDGWLTRYFDADVEGFEAETDGIYSVMDRVRAFPLGTRRAGNVDHRSKDGYRVSWYGPTSRVALDAHINPGVVWLDKVFMHGQVLLTHPLGYGIFGAGFHAGSLFTVEGEVAALPVPYPAPESMTGYQNPPLSVATGTQLHVCRYPCSASMTPNRRRTFSADPEAREVLLTLDWDGKEQYPWTFNPDCTEVSGMSTSEPGGYEFASHMYLAYRKSYMPTGGGPQVTQFRFADSDNQFSGAEALFPAEHDTRYTVTITKDEAGYTAEAVAGTVSLPAESVGSAVVARDYDEDGNRIDLLVERDTLPAADGAPSQEGILFLRLGEQRWPVLSQNGPRIRDDGPAAYIRRSLLHADLPNQTLVFAVRKYTYTFYEVWETFFDVDVESRENRIEVWRRGEQIADVLVSTTEGADDTGHLSWPWKLLDDYGFKTIPHCLLSVPLAPSFALYGYAMALETTHPLDEPQPPSPPPGTGYFFGALGANATYFYSAWPGDFNFGWWQSPLGVPTPEQVIDYPELQAQDVDLNVRYIPLWAATLGEHTRISGPSYKFDAPADAFTWSDVDQPTTATLTGVGGTHQRYHPLWRLGRFDLVQGASP